MNDTWYSYRSKKTSKLGFTRYTYSVSDAWSTVSGFHGYFHNSNKWESWFECQTTKKSTATQRHRVFNKYADLVKTGAVILMDFKFDGIIKYTHAAIVVGTTLNDIKYAAHSNNRWWHSLLKTFKAGEIERFIIYNIGYTAI